MFVVSCVLDAHRMVADTLSTHDVLSDAGGMHKTMQRVVLDEMG